MRKPLILVTGATGKTGSAIVAQLLEQNWPVRALVHRRDARSERLHRLGAAIFVADMYDPDQMAEALRGVARVYYCPPIQPHMIQAATAFAVAARDAGLESVVHMSQWLSSPTHPSPMTRQTWLADRLLATIPDVSYTILNPGWFADNNLRVIGFAAHLGIFPVLTGDSRNAPPSNEDIARVAVAVLQDPVRHAGKRYRPTGPKLLSAHDMIAVLRAVLRRNVVPVPMPLWLLYKAGIMQGESKFAMASLRYYIEDHIQGAFEWNAPTGDVLQVTGRPAEDFETTVRRYAALPEAQRSLANTIREAAKFLRTPFAPGLNAKRYERELGLPQIGNPRFAMQDERWKSEHAGDGHHSHAVQDRRLKSHDHNHRSENDTPFRTAASGVAGGTE